MIQFLILAAAAVLTGCNAFDNDEEKDSSENKNADATDSGSLALRGRETVVRQNESDSPIQTLVPSADGTGCVAIMQTHGDGYFAEAQLTDPIGTQYDKFQIQGSTRGTLGWGQQLEDGRFVFPLQSLTNDTHGVLITDENGNELAYHDLAAQNLTGPGAVVSGANGSLYTVTNNADYIPGGVQFSRDSSLVKFDAESTLPSSYETYPLGLTNATGLGQDGNQLLIAGAGDYAYPGTAEIAAFDLDGNHPVYESRVPSVNGLGLNGVLPVQNGYTLLSGFSETPVALYDEKDVLPLDINETLQGDWVAGAQFFDTDDDEMGIVLNSHDSNNNTMSVYALAGNPRDNIWQIESSWLFDANSPVSIVEYAPGKKCVATDSTVYYLAAE